MPLLHGPSLRSKFACLGAVAMMIAALPTGLYVNQTLAEIDSATLEAKGALPVAALRKVVQLTQQHRGQAAGMLGGNELLAARRPDTRDALGKAIAELEASLKTADAPTPIMTQWAGARQSWVELEQAVANRQLKPTESSAKHTQLIADQLAFNAELVDVYGLSLDPQANTYYVILATHGNTLALAEKLGQLRARGTGSLATGDLPAEGRAGLAVTEGAAIDVLVALERNLAKATAGDAQVRAALGAQVDTLKTQVKKTLETVNTALIMATELKHSASDCNQEFTNTINAVYVFNAAASNEVARLLETRVSYSHRTLAVVSGILLSLLVGAVSLSLAFLRSMTVPLSEALQVARAVSQGDLTVAVPVRGDNEMGQLMQALKEMQANLAQVVSGVRSNADSVATASTQIAQGNNDLSQRAEQQAASLQVTAASMEQLSSTVKQNADNAMQANQLANSASGVAVNGSRVVGMVVDTMKGINDASKEIAEIIGVIDSIAFQTNILALNAAVEAARAGEQCRGFAVVATEVRSLAGRSADAAKQIKSLITRSVERVEHGTTQVDQARAAMTEVVSSIKRVTDIMSEISAATVEQSTGVTQVGEAVSQMDQVTQQNSALVEESAAAAESLKGQARQLVQSVAVFKLANG